MLGDLSLLSDSIHQNSFFSVVFDSFSCFSFGLEKPRKETRRETRIGKNQNNEKRNHVQKENRKEKNKKTKKRKKERKEREGRNETRRRDRDKKTKREKKGT